MLAYEKIEHHCMEIGVAGLVIGIILIAFAAWVGIEVHKRDQAFAKRRFGHTNANGVLTFESFEHAKEFERAELKIKVLNDFAGVTVAISGLVGLVFIGLGIFALNS